jgi:uncharacterized protein (DUF1501 family)
MNSRRNFLKTGIGAALVNGIFGRGLLAQGAGSPKKMIFIFQRGANDGLNTVIPRGDLDYNTDNRPSVYIPESAVTTAGTDLGNGFAQLHPAMAPMMPLYNAGDLALIHRVGYPNLSRSHFNSQDYLEKGIQGDSAAIVKDGMLYRHLANTIDLGDPNNTFTAASISSSQLFSLKGAQPFPNFNRISDFGFLGGDTERAKFLGSPPTAPGAGDGKGILGLYGTDPSTSTEISDLMHETGKALGNSVATVAAASGDYTPENGAVYPGGDFGRKLEEAAILLKRTPARVVGINIGGWDLHSNQGAAVGSHANRLSDIAEGYAALALDLQSQWDDVLVVTMTEFGRTSLENGSNGTDHGEANVMMVGGGSVTGGVFNCDAASWEAGAQFARRERYLSRKTDFRAVFGEIFERHFGDDPSLFEAIMPGYTIDKFDYPSEFNYMNFLT